MKLDDTRVLRSLHDYEPRRWNPYPLGYLVLGALAGNRW